MNAETWIGLGASILCGIAQVPQVVKVAREKNVEGISLRMIAILATGLALWIVYGYLKDDWIIIIANAFALVINLVLMRLAIKYKE